MALPRMLIDAKLIYLPTICDDARGRDVLARFPDAELATAGLYKAIMRANIVSPILRVDTLDQLTPRQTSHRA